MLWTACHIFGKNLAYFGYNGTGKQVRDVLHVDDLCRLIALQGERIGELTGEIFNVGGGAGNSISLREMTSLCREVTGVTISVSSEPVNRPNDLIWYITDNAKVSRSLGWQPEKTVKETITDISRWIQANKHLVSNIF